MMKIACALLGLSIISDLAVIIAERSDGHHEATMFIGGVTAVLFMIAFWSFSFTMGKIVGYKNGFHEGASLMTDVNGGHKAFLEHLEKMMQKLKDEVEK